ncbi:MAG: hypothetical protein ACFFDI_06185 [Promethearchaeota archaeon]
MQSYFESIYWCEACAALKGHALDYDCFNELNEEYFKKQASVSKFSMVK